jgi:GntR family transcriptional repressor for pyruvate dehydrogenase complex
MRAHLEAMERPDVPVPDFNDRDTAFHVAIAQASGNPLVAEMTTALRHAMRLTLLDRLTASADYPATRRRLCAEHQGILAALQSGRGARAADLVEAHIRDFYQALGSAAPGGSVLRAERVQHDGVQPVQLP